jgi:hypothetical protein
MAFNASTIHQLHQLLKLALQTGAGINNAGQLLVTIPDTKPLHNRSAKALYSDGVEQWTWLQGTSTNSIPGRTFAVAASERYVELYSAADASWVTGLYSTGSSITAINSETLGVLDLSAFPNLTAVTLNAIPAIKIIGNFNNTAPIFRFFASNQPLDLSECAGLTRLEMTGSFCTDIIFPPAAANPNLSFIDLSENRITNKDVVLPAYASLTTLNLSTGVGSSINTLNIAATSNLAIIQVISNKLKDIVYASGNYASLTTFNATRHRFSTRTEYGGNIYGNGVDTGLIPLLANSINLLSINLGSSGMSGSEIAAVIAAIHSNRASRPTTTSRTMVVGGQDMNYAYPAYNLSTTIGNDSVVDQSSRDKIRDLLRQNWFISFNIPRGFCSYSASLGNTVVRVTFNTDKTIDCWAVGDIVTASAGVNTGGAFPMGNYRIAASSPGGKVWDLEAIPGNTALNISSTQSGAVTVDKTLSYRFKFAGVGYTDTAGNLWPAVSNGSTYNSSFSPSGTQELVLYNRMCTGTAPFTLTGLLNGTYVARCHFFDDSSTAAGQQVFDVKFDGVTVLSNLDIRSEVGTRVAQQKEVTIVVSGNQTVLQLGAVTGTPVISAVELIRVTD